MRKFALLCAVLGLSIGFSACGSDDDSKGAIGDSCSANADCESGNCDAGVCKAKKEEVKDACDGKKEGDSCNDDGSKTCQTENDALVCKDKPAEETDLCKDKKEGDSCNTDGTKTCQTENDALVCKDKPAEETDLCKDKKEGDSCNTDGTKTCQTENDALVCKDKPAEETGCAKDDDCTSAFPKCDTEAKKCYKVNASYAPTCSSADNKKTAYTAEWLYADDSQSKILSQECTGDTPDCKNGACVAEAQEYECSLDSDCTSKAPKTKCDVATHTCVEPQATTDECDESDSKNCETGKTCVAGKCLDEAAEQAACDASSFVERCTSNMRSLLSCEDSKVVRNDCGSGFTCQYDSKGTAECVENCPSFDFNENDIQYSDCDSETNTAYNYICEKDYYKSGYLFAFERTEACGTDKTCKANADAYSGEKAVCEAKSN